MTKDLNLLYATKALAELNQPVNITAYNIVIASNTRHPTLICTIILNSMSTTLIVLLIF
jgi:hypothetical protein